MSAVRIEDLGFAYHPNAWVLRALDAEVPRGGVLAVLGPNGRGKSTLLQLVAGAMRPLEGRVRLDGDAAFVPQLTQVNFDYSVLDMVLMGRARHVGLFSQPNRRDEARARAALERFGLADLSSQSFHEISGGQRQLVILARALASEASILVLDEPTAALDMKHQVAILSWIRTLAHHDGMTVIFSTHRPEHAALIADQSILLYGPADHLIGATETTLNETTLSRLYDVPIRKIVCQDGCRYTTTFVQHMIHLEVRDQG